MTGAHDKVGHWEQRFRGVSSSIGFWSMLIAPPIDLVEGDEIRSATTAQPSAAPSADEPPARWRSPEARAWSAEQKAAGL